MEVLADSVKVDKYRRAKSHPAPIDIDGHADERSVLCLGERRAMGCELVKCA